MTAGKILLQTGFFVKTNGVGFCAYVFYLIFEISLNAACLSLVALAFSCIQEKESEACQCGFHHVCATVFPDCCSAQPVSCVTKIGNEGHFSRTKSDCGTHVFVGIG